MLEIGRFLMLAGLVLTAVGGLVWLIGKSGFRGLPGDLVYEGQSFRFYFPVVTCIVLSIGLTLLAWFWRWLSGR
ncbi:MAG: DUF2905 domain-containing protein [Phycisphaerae bacterium]|nr:DUF2905 domain-containing protein [Phycisphaerae bacterium]MDW8262993.1 DUF2905 domain-containing protein [Phycisphaerales bacterium]